MQSWTVFYRSGKGRDVRITTVHTPNDDRSEAVAEVERQLGKPGRRSLLDAWRISGKLLRPTRLPATTLACPRCNARTFYQPGSMFVPHEIDWDVDGYEDGYCPHCRPSLPAEPHPVDPF